MNLYYKPQIPEEGLIEKGSREVSKYMMVRLFEETMPDFKKMLQQTLGAFASDIRKTDPSIADDIDNVRLNNEGVMDIFYNSLEDDTNELEVTEQISGDMAERNNLNQGEVDTGTGDAGGSYEEGFDNPKGENGSV